MFWLFFRVIGATIAVSLLAYFTTKLFAKSRMAQSNDLATNLQIVESIGIGAGNVVQIIKVGAKYIVIGVTKEQITMLTELSASEVQEIETVTVPFNKVLSRFLPKAKDGQREEDSE